MHESGFALLVRGVEVAPSVSHKGRDVGAVRPSGRGDARAHHARRRRQPEEEQVRQRHDRDRLAHTLAQGGFPAPLLRPLRSLRPLPTNRRATCGLGREVGLPRSLALLVALVLVLPRPTNLRPK